MRRKLKSIGRQRLQLVHLRAVASGCAAADDIEAIVEQPPDLFRLIDATSSAIGFRWGCS